MNLPSNPSEAFKKLNPHIYGVDDERKPWEAREIEILKAVYENALAAVDVSALAVQLNRSYASVALKASRLGLGDYTRTKRPESVNASSSANKAHWDGMTKEQRVQKSSQLIPFQGVTFLGKKHTQESKEKMSKAVKASQKELGYPRGMLGKHHSENTKARLSENGAGKKISRETIIKRLKTLHSNSGKAFLDNRRKTSWKSHWVEIGGQRFYARSLWEANYARYLEFLKQHGEVLSWQHEPETFWFNKIKRGCVSYLPDFKVVTWMNDVEYHEVKGWMDARSKTKIKRMAKYYPEKRLVVIDSKRYRALSVTGRRLIPGWVVLSKSSPKGLSS